MSSKVSYRGMMKKASIWIVIGTASVIEQAVVQTLPDQFKGAVPIPLAKMTAAFFLFVEAISILENCRRAGVPLPRFLSNSLVEVINRLDPVTGEKKERLESITVEHAEIVMKHQEIPTDPDDTHESS
jgi:phage-related holin